MVSAGGNRDGAFNSVGGGDVPPFMDLLVEL